MNILHTEASPGWGGQELRILMEAKGMRSRGHTIIFAVQKGGKLAPFARREGFAVYELSFKKKSALITFFRLLVLIRKHRIQSINTHSSLDAWLAGVAGKTLGRPVIRTRHLSTPVRKGWNTKVLYGWLADCVVTTCQSAAETLREQANLSENRCQSIPTGVDPLKVTYDAALTEGFRKRLGVKPEDCLVGTLCVLRGWKGITDLLHAAKLLELTPHLKWVVIGGGVSEAYFLEQRRQLKLENEVHFTGHLPVPFTALAALDIFLLLSWANEGVSQASLQAAWLEKPLITTSVGGLPEVCLEGKTGIIVPPNKPAAVAEAVKRLLDAPLQRKQMGRNAKKLVASQFTFEGMLDRMEKVHSSALSTLK